MTIKQSIRDYILDMYSKELQYPTKEQTLEAFEWAVKQSTILRYYNWSIIEIENELKQNTACIQQYEEWFTTWLMAWIVITLIPVLSFLIISYFI